MLEMKPDGGIKTGPGPDPGPEISFEMPAHEMCLERRAVLSRLDGQSEYMTFVIDFMPDVIWIDGRKFKYGWVSDGRGFYREEPKDAHEAKAIAVCKHLGLPVDLMPLPDGPFELRGRVGGSDSMHETAENATPGPHMQCSRCSEVLDLVSQMIENPPGLSGIRCHLGHVGNHYVDAGWVEALTRVKWHLVTGGSGTRERI